MDIDSYGSKGLIGRKKQRFFDRGEKGRKKKKVYEGSSGVVSRGRGDGSMLRGRGDSSIFRGRGGVYHDEKNEKKGF